MYVKYVDRELLDPKFGYVDMVNQTAYVRNDLPNIVKDFVTEHEIYHLYDESKYWLWREIKANTYAAIRHPLGFVVCCLMSLSVNRLKYYIKRFKDGA